MQAHSPSIPSPSIPSPSIPSPPPSPMRISLDCIKSFPSGSAPGSSSFQLSHCKEAILCPSPVYSNKTLLAILDIVNLLRDGHIPSDVVLCLCGTILLACRKKNSGFVQ